jgi:biotin carboxylase
VTAEAAARLGLPGPGATAAAPLRNRIALRRHLALAGVTQPDFAAARTVHEGHTALATVGVPAVLKPAEPRGAAPVHLVRSEDDLDAHLYLALASSATEEAIVERFHEGLAVEAACWASNGSVTVLAVLDRPEQNGRTRLYPSTLFGDALAAVERTALHALHALSFANGVTTVQLVAGSGPPLVVDVALWTPNDPLDALLSVATGVDLLELAIRAALGADVHELLTRARFHQPAALRALDERADIAPSTAHEEGYVVVEAATNVEALQRAITAAQPSPATGERSSHATASATSSPADRHTPPRSRTASSSPK